jgi:hypothetical protein
MIFIDLEEAYDKILKNIMWWALEKKRVPIEYVIFHQGYVQNIIVTCVRICDVEPNILSLKIWLYQGSALSLYIFYLSDG